ncbi:M48 family peptidase [Aquabacterium lacunae]|uniref:M48 family peptidase n=1 Tax=Aquabacterium lacunae TaxID=2528630 RepID=A0A4Q9H5K7_9BURK|nr:SprT family zinc-dependent metalloprotease [Aquabacterium lacunae]TBO34054.1 M48 family peptidase [Aquabacterium lacunae]
MNTLVADDLTFDVRLSAARRTLGITVGRMGDLVLSCPPGVPEAQLRDFVMRKRAWVYKQLARKEALQHVVPRKVFVDGEGLTYLGRTYRLRLIDGPAGPVKLTGGRFVMPKATAIEGSTHMVRWYSERAKPWLESKVIAFADRMEAHPSGLNVQDLGYRWGSCGKGARLYFHWKTILLPARIAEYVVVHELAHLHEPHHTPEFWQRVERAMPDYTRRKAWLAEHGMSVEGLQG